MSGREMKESLRRFYEAAQRGDLEEAALMFAPHFRLNGQELTRQDWIQQRRAFRQAFPDQRVTVEHTMWDGDWVAEYVTSEGTFQGAFMGIPPTGERLRTTGVQMGRFESGQMVEAWTATDLMRTLVQGGVLVPAKAAPEQTTASASP